MRALYNGLVCCLCPVCYDLVLWACVLLLVCLWSGIVWELVRLSLSSIVCGLPCVLCCHWGIFYWQLRRLMSIGYKSIVLNVLSRFGNAIDSGTGKPGAVAGLPWVAPPRRGTAHRRRSRRESLEFPKISKRNKKTLFRWDTKIKKTVMRQYWDTYK